MDNTNNTTHGTATLEDLQKVCNLLFTKHGWRQLQIVSMTSANNAHGKTSYNVVASLAGLGEFTGNGSDPFMAFFNGIVVKFGALSSGAELQFCTSVDEVQAEIDARSPVCKTLEEHVFVLSGSSCFRCGQTADEVFLKKI